MKRLQARTLFGKTLFTITVVSVLFQLFALSVFAFFLLFPLGKRAAEDLASVLIDAARVWSRTPDKSDAEHFLRVRRLFPAPSKLAVNEPSLLLPYVRFLQSALHNRLGPRSKLWSTRDVAGEDWYWADIPVDGGIVRLGFPRSRIAVRPPEALLLVLAVGVVVTVAMVIVLVHRLTRPLDRLAQAARRIGSGPWPEPLPEDGAEELAALARSFNRMNRQVQALLANRTTLLSGISHDLRTPLARMNLAVEMIPRHAAPELIAGIERDLAEMDRLLGLFLDVSHGMEAGAGERIEIGSLLRELAADARRSGASVHVCEGPWCEHVLAVMPLRRILCNLIENAVRYGAPAPVDVEFSCGAFGTEIRVLDRGPGIPEEEREQVFRPFYRLEHSRNHTTGGSGLGLAIARQLANANGWHVELRERAGGGTASIVMLSVGLRGQAGEELFEY